jgi:hypothetical protein
MFFSRFYNEFGSPGLIDMINQLPKFKNLSQRFVDKYVDIARRNENRLTDDEIFKATEEELKAEGFPLRIYQKTESNKLSSSISTNINQILNDKD